MLVFFLSSALFFIASRAQPAGSVRAVFLRTLSTAIEPKSPLPQKKTNRLRRASFFRVVPTVVTRRHQFQILNAVVLLVAVFVMYEFRTQQGSSKQFFHHNAMHVSSPLWRHDLSVAVSRHVDIPNRALSLGLSMGDSPFVCPNSTGWLQQTQSVFIFHRRGTSLPHLFGLDVAFLERSTVRASHGKEG